MSQEAENGEIYILVFGSLTPQDVSPRSSFIPIKINILNSEH